VSKLKGAVMRRICAPRSLVIALWREGETMVNRSITSTRFERLEDKLSACGAAIERIAG